MAEADVHDPAEIIKSATYTLPVRVWLWLKEEARKRDTSASNLIVLLVDAEQKREVA